MRRYVARVRPSPPPCTGPEPYPVSPPAEALHSVEPKRFSPPILPPSVPLQQNYSVQSLVSLLGDCAELEGLGSRFQTISGPLSSIWAVGSGPDGVRHS